MHWVPTFEYAFYELETKTSKPNCKSNKNLSTACKWIRNLPDYLYNFHYHCNCIRAKIHLSVSLNPNWLFEYNWCTFLQNCTVARFRLNPEDIRCDNPQWINYRIYWNSKMRTTSSCKKTSASLNIYLWVYVFSVGNIPWIIQVSRGWKRAHLHVKHVGDTGDISLLESQQKFIQSNYTWQCYLFTWNLF